MQKKNIQQVVMEQQDYSQNNTKLTPEREPLFKIEMFTFLFKGKTSNREDLYYNNLQDKNIQYLLLLFILTIPSKETSRGRYF
jgi:hypothetical protein